jgi:hypothetical protein
MTWIKEKKSRKAIAMAGGAVVLVVIGAVVAGLLLTKPLAEGEDFAVHAGELVLAVRSTDFMVT